MSILISAFAWVPEFAQGYVKDIRPRWALAEAGLDYEVRLVDGTTTRTAPTTAAGSPSGRCPAYRDDEVELFESGAIVLRIASLSERLAPRDAQEAAQTQAWVFAALNSIEPKVDNLILPGVFHAGEDWVAGHAAPCRTARRPAPQVALGLARGPRMARRALQRGRHRHGDGAARP
jgi:glutathione S-transferase